MMHYIIIENKTGVQILKMDQALIKRQSDLGGIIDLLTELRKGKTKVRTSKKKKTTS